MRDDPKMDRFKEVFLISQNATIDLVSEVEKTTKAHMLTVLNTTLSSMDEGWKLDNADEVFVIRKAMEGA